MKTFWKKNPPPPPYYAVIFSTEKKENINDYEETNDRAMQAALSMEGCLGYNSAPGTFISYWDSMESINKWRNNSLHKQAKERGINEWYAYYHSLICKVEYAHEFFSPEQGTENSRAAH